jgi:hypothetical protein
MNSRRPVNSDVSCTRCNVNLDQAKKLFFKYDGSSFYMAHDGVAEEYRSANVPIEKEREWMADLTQQKLTALAENGNWQVVHFLNHHQDYQHLEKVMRTDAKGAFWERCSFLEGLLDYSIGSKQRSSKSIMVAAISKVIDEAQKLVKAAKSEQSSRRASALVSKATASLNKVSE